MRRIHLFPMLIFFIVLIGEKTQAQGSISGRVYDAETNAILAGANILIEELPIGTISDGEGRFSFSTVLPGDYTVSAGFVGYRVLKIKIAIRGNEEYPLIFALKPMILSGQSIEITSTRAIEGETPPFCRIHLDR